ncbi:hypothetical protein [Aquiflexum sp.]|uniref:hypothetical protein n=1 Tax=Aquiflexum sp. TaxID=1872584 RepID=UPI0035939527
MYLENFKYLSNTEYNNHLHRDEDGDFVLNSSPRPFLNIDNTCLVYEERHKNCKEYPPPIEKTFMGI